MPRIFMITNRRFTQDSARYDLLVDGQPVMEQVTFRKASTYVLGNIAAWDSYSYQESPEDEDVVSITGARFTHTHATRMQEIANLPQQPCKRCTSPTTWIGYCDIPPRRSGWQKTFFMQCRECGLYRQIGFANGEDWTGQTYRQLMQERIPFMRTARDPFLRNGTLRVTSRTVENPMGRLNLDGHEFATRELISVYDQEAEEWRDGRVEYAYGLESDPSDLEKLRKEGHWYFAANDGLPGLTLRQGMKARLIGE